jgi:hypothetical protein
MDTEAFNYDDTVTYACADCCIPVIGGCMESWADNYNNWYSAANGYSGVEFPELSFGLEFHQELQGNDLDINTNVTGEGECFKLGCTDPLAVSEYYYGFDPQATVSDESCVYVVYPRGILGKIICVGEYDVYEGNFNYPVCNTIEEIVGDGTEENPYTIETIPSEDIYANHHLYSSNVEEEDFVSTALSPDNLGLEKSMTEILIGDRSYSGIKNCVENPILEDGSGGCIYLKSSLFEQCYYPEIISSTHYGCEDASIFAGGLAGPSDIVSPDSAIGFTTGECGEEVEYNYFISNEFLNANVIGTEILVISSGSLPELSYDQCQTYEGLDLPGCVETVRSNRKASSSKSRNITNIVYEILYTTNSTVYLGYIIIQEGFRFAYNNTTGEVGEQLYTRNEILRLGGPLIAEEVITKKFHNITNKIINLINFTG